MVLKYIKRYFNLKALKEDLRKLAVNLMSAGIVGIYINHYVGTELSTMFWASVSIVISGGLLLALSIMRRKK